MKNHQFLKLLLLLYTVFIWFSCSKEANDQEIHQEKRIELNGVTFEFILIPAGEFVMGSPGTEMGRSGDEGRQHNVNIKNDFWLGKTEVTQSQWMAVMGQNAAYFQESVDHPVEWISWNEIQGFIEILNEKTGMVSRLPSEAEWEYACRAGTTSPFHTGDILTSGMANFNGNYPYGTNEKGVSFNKTTPVGSYPANKWGLLDMHGNVWEWCEDVYMADIYDHTEKLSTNISGNPVYIGEENIRILRGGGWLGNGNGCRSAARGGEKQGNAFNYIGFRLALVNR